MGNVPPAPGSPLEWWEHIQLNLLESIGCPEEAAHFRAHPDEWRAYREGIGERVRHGRAGGKS